MIASIVCAFKYIHFEFFQARRVGYFYENSSRDPVCWPVTCYGSGAQFGQRGVKFASQKTPERFNRRKSRLRK